MWFYEFLGLQAISLSVNFVFKLIASGLTLLLVDNFIVGAEIVSRRKKVRQ